jgi:phosphatidylglycerol:prolipoprotein diacylglycerol transferase
MGTVIILAGIFGIAGSKLFHILENLPQFFQDPMRMIFSAGGLTFYGGLICAGLAITWYVKKKGIAPSLMADAVAPGLILAYGIGRIGCHLSGDGDWGITSNLADKPGWIPHWLWAETYPNNINGEVLLGDGVFPTPLYEFAMSLVLFGVLWALRRHPFKSGWLFGLYLVFAGAERLLIEQIRVNNTFDLFGMTVTQAEVISVIMILIGLLLLIRTTQKRAKLSSSKNVMPATG